MTTIRLDGPHTSAAMTEEIDSRAGRVRVRGRLTRQGVDLLRGTVDCLCRQGHALVVVDLTAVHAADDGTLAELDALRRSDRGSGHTVVLVNAP